MLAGAVLVTFALVAGVVGRAASEPKLPRVGPKALVVTTLRALGDPPPISGKLHTHVDLGLPPLPDEARLEGVLGLLMGDRDFRIWSSEDGARIAEMLEGAERAIIAGRSEVWLWDSERFEAAHIELPTGVHDPGNRGSGNHDSNEGTHRRMSAPQRYSGIDPAEVVRHLLGELEDTDVSVDSIRNVAGRDAYVIEIRPLTRKTLVGRIEVAIDAAERIPLSYAVYAKGATDPAISVGFTEVGFDAIDSATFSFEPPAGAKVVEKGSEGRRPGGLGLGGPRMEGRADAKREWLDHRQGAGRAALKGPLRPRGRPGVRSFGSGWATVFAVRIDGSAEGRRGSVSGGRPGVIELPAETRRLLPFEGDLLSAALLERPGGSWIAFGAVPLGALEAVAPQLP